MTTTEEYLVTPQTAPQIEQQAAGDSQTGSLKAIEADRARSYLVPGIVTILQYLAVAALLVFLLNWSNIFAVINRTAGSDARSLGEALKVYSDNYVVSWITIILFWGTVGLAVYTFFWLGMAFITAARNELIVETSFSKRGHFWDKVRVPLIKLLLLFGTAIVFIISLRFGVPAWSSFAGAGIFALQSSLAVAIGYIFGAILAAAINIYILMTLIVFFRHAEAVF